MNEQPPPIPSASPAPDPEKVLKTLEFIAPSRGNVSRQRWFIVLTDRRLIFYGLKGGGWRTLVGALAGASAGFALAAVIAGASAGSGGDFLPRFSNWAIWLCLLGVVIGSASMQKGGSKTDVTPPWSVESLESQLRDSAEQYIFEKPQVPEVKMRTPFMGGISVRLGKRRRLSFAHEPLYTEIKGVLESFSGAQHKTES
jgi:hypothetical protein